MTPTELLALAQQWAPHLRLDPTTATLDESGADALVLLVDGDWDGPEPRGFARRLSGRRRWVFRFPRREEVAARMEVEGRVLPWVGVQLPVPVPRVAVRGMMPDGATRFTGAVSLTGEPLDPAVLLTGRGGLLLSQLAGTLATLHALSPRAAVDAGLPPPGPDPAAARLRGWLARGNAEVLPLLDRASDAAALAQWWDEWAEEPPPAPAVVHGDLGPVHVLVDPARGVLTGLLDWTDLAVGDPAEDLADLTAAHPLVRPAVLTAWADATDDLAADSGEPAEVDRDALTRRVERHVEAGPLRCALRGLDTGDADTLTVGLGALSAQARALTG